MTLTELRAKVAEVDGKIAALQGQCVGRLPNDEEARDLNGLLAENTKLIDAIKLEQGIEDARAFNAAPQTVPSKPMPGDSRASAASEMSYREAFGTMLQGIAARGGYPRFTDAQKRAIEKRAGTGMNEGIGSEGGFLLQPTYASEFLTKTYATAVLAGRTDQFTLGEGTNSLIFNAIDEQSRVAGSRWGGVQFSHLPEAGTKQPTHPLLRQVKLEPKKLAGLYWMTDELLQDAPSAGAICEQAFRSELAYQIDNDLYNGTGAGQALGVLNAPALVTVAAENGQGAATVVTENIFNMWSRMFAPCWQNSIWVCNQDVLPQLFSMYLAVGVGGVPVYMPANGVSGSPYGTLMGRPVIPMEQCPTLGTVGDIALLDMSEYVLADKGSPVTASSMHVHFTTDETVFRMVYRFDAQPKWNSALTPASGSANTLSPFVVLATRA